MFPIYENERYGHKVPSAHARILKPVVPRIKNQKRTEDPRAEKSRHTEKTDQTRQRTMAQDGCIHRSLMDHYITP